MRIEIYTQPNGRTHTARATYHGRSVTHTSTDRHTAMRRAVSDAYRAANEENR